MSEEFTVRVDEKRGSSVAVSAHGPLHPAGAQLLKKTCLDFVERGFQRLIIDLGGVGFVCSSGIGSLLVVSEACEAQGGSVYLVNPSKAVNEVLKLLCLEDELNVLPSREAAFEAVGTTERA